MFTYVSCFLIVYYSYSLVKFVNLLMMWIAEQAPVVAILKLKPKVLDRQTCPQIWFRLYTKKYFAAIIILEDNLFSTDKDRKKCNFIEIRQEKQWPMYILPNATSICSLNTFKGVPLYLHTYSCKYETATYITRFSCGWYCLRNRDKANKG